MANIKMLRLVVVSYYFDENLLLLMLKQAFFNADCTN